MDFNKMNYLMAVAELKSFSKAAEKCYVSQPALTRCIKSIEEEVGLKLFDRSCTPICLTYAGERYLARMQEILELKIKLDQEMAEIAARKRDKLVIGIAFTRSATWLPRVLPRFRQEYPDVEIEVKEGNSANMEKLLESETIDLYLMGTEPILTKGIEMIPFYKEEMILVVSRQAGALQKYCLPENQPGVVQYLPPRLLNHIPFFSATPSQGTYYLAHRIFDQFDLHPETSLELYNTSAAYQVAPSGKGFAFAPVSVTFEEVFHPEPIFCSLSPVIDHRTIGILYKAARRPSAAAEAFISVAAREVTQYAKRNLPSFQVRYDIDYTANLGETGSL